MKLNLDPNHGNNGTAFTDIIGIQLVPISHPGEIDPKVPPDNKHMLKQCFKENGETYENMIFHPPP